MNEIDLNKKAQVEQFHRTYKAYIQNIPGFPSEEIRKLRIDLLSEEFNEYKDAEISNNFVEACDALGDMLYIIYGTCVSYGIPIDEIFNEIHRSNMSKLGKDGKPIYREDGKVLKGPDYFKPNIASIIENFKNSQ